MPLFCVNPDEETVQYKVYIKLNDTKSAVNYQYFGKTGFLGYNCLHDYRFRDMKSSYDDVLKTVVELLTSEHWVIGDTEHIMHSRIKVPEWLRNRVKDNKKNLDLSKIEDVAKDFNKQVILRDFSIKMREGKIRGYQDYYE